MDKYTIHKKSSSGRTYFLNRTAVMGYTFSKVAEGIHSPDGSNITFGLSMLHSIQKTYVKFEAALSERGDLNDYIKYDLDEYNHVLTKLEGCLSNGCSKLSEKDAMIYHFYIREQHNHFVEIANEIDESYQTKV